MIDDNNGVLQDLKVSLCSNTPRETLYVEKDWVNNNKYGICSRFMGSNEINRINYRRDERSNAYIEHLKRINVRPATFYNYEIFDNNLSDLSMLELLFSPDELNTDLKGSE